LGERVGIIKQTFDISVLRRSIGSCASRHLVDAALAHASDRGWTISVAVVDISGDIVALGRMDGAPPTIAEFAGDKAFTAAMVSKSTRAFFERMASSPELTMGLSTRRRLLCWEGGLPIVFEGVVIGGIGVSGATGPEDAECATAALKSLDLTVEMG
jgi:glc operon protein GlcG